MTENVSGKVYHLDTPEDRLLTRHGPRRARFRTHAIPSARLEPRQADHKKRWSAPQGLETCATGRGQVWKPVLQGLIRAPLQQRITGTRQSVVIMVWADPERISQTTRLLGYELP